MSSRANSMKSDGYCWKASVCVRENVCCILATNPLAAGRQTEGTTIISIFLFINYFNYALHKCKRTNNHPASQSTNEGEFSCTVARIPVFSEQRDTTQEIPCVCQTVINHRKSFLLFFIRNAIGSWDAFFPSELKLEQKCGITEFAIRLSGKRVVFSFM